MVLINIYNYVAFFKRWEIRSSCVPHKTGCQLLVKVKYFNFYLSVFSSFILYFVDIVHDWHFFIPCSYWTSAMISGGLGTKRFCSSLDLGNYCNYIKQPGDQLEYRSCVFTCSTDGCNLAGSKRPHHLVILLSVALLTIIAVS